MFSLLQISIRMIIHNLKKYDITAAGVICIKRAFHYNAPLFKRGNSIITQVCSMFIILNKMEISMCDITMITGSSEIIL